MALVDLVVTRREEDPTTYRPIVARCPDVNLIEVPYVPGSFVTARMNLVLYGEAEYISWFDPDDLLYAYTLPLMIAELKKDRDLPGVLTLSDYSVSTGRKRRIELSKMLEKPVHSHFMRIVKRSWLEENLYLFDTPVPEWPMMAKALEDGCKFLPWSGYCWIVGSGDHTRITPERIQDTRLIVQTIAGSKYQQLVKELSQ